MKLSNTETIANQTIKKTLGIARGSTVRSRNIGRDIFASLKNIVGGEIEEYTKLQADAREQALQRMIEDAQKLEADAVVNVRFTTSVVAQGASEMLAYGTAVKFEQMTFMFYGALVIALVVLAIIKYNERKNDDFDKRNN